MACWPGLRQRCCTRRLQIILCSATRSSYRSVLASIPCCFESATLSIPAHTMPCMLNVVEMTRCSSGVSVRHLRLLECGSNQGGCRFASYSLFRADRLSATLQVCSLSNKRLLQGAVVGFSMCKVYCLQDTTLHTYDVPLSATVRALLKRNDLHQAFQVLLCLFPLLICASL